jgi:hypothetical protein
MTFKYILWEQIYCDCCAKCIAILRQEVYRSNDQDEYLQKIEDLKLADRRHEVYTINDGKKIVFHDNVLSFFR